MRNIIISTTFRGVVLVALVGALTLWDADGISQARAAETLQKGGQTIKIKRSRSKPNSRYYIIKNGREIRVDGNYNAAVKSYKRRGWAAPGAATTPSKTKAQLAKEAAAKKARQQAALKAQKEAAERERIAAERSKVLEAASHLIDGYMAESDTVYGDMMKDWTSGMAFLPFDEMAKMDGAITWSTGAPVGTVLGAAVGSYQIVTAFQEGDVLDGLTKATEVFFVGAVEMTATAACGNAVCGVAAGVAYKQTLGVAESLGNWLGSEAYDFFAGENDAEFTRID
ncbi:MAG: hypothetical protein V7695_14400 [Sulfitobacter sp.]